MRDTDKGRRGGAPSTPAGDVCLNSFNFVAAARVIAPDWMALPDHKRL